MPSILTPVPSFRQLSLPTASPSSIIPCPTAIFIHETLSYTFTILLTTFHYRSSLPPPRLSPSPIDQKPFSQRPCDFQELANILLALPSPEDVSLEVPLSELGLTSGAAVLLRDELQREVKHIRHGNPWCDRARG